MQEDYIEPSELDSFALLGYDFCYVYFDFQRTVKWTPHSYGMKSFNHH
jgi:hypothetical protein